MSPRGIGSLVSMMLVGRVIGRIDSRWLLAFGFSVLAYATYRFSGLDLNIAPSNIQWPNLITGFALGFIFVPLTTTTVGTLENQQIGNAMGLSRRDRSAGFADLKTKLLN